MNRKNHRQDAAKAIAKAFEDFSKTENFPKLKRRLNIMKFNYPKQKRIVICAYKAQPLCGITKQPRR